ncbi:MAG TPA: FlgD immunoglobulin-like domain containing protein [bacterium]|nr:FlgD immunoglobulin-like domain containing protein [bacterium]
MSRSFAVLLCCWMLTGAASARAELHRLGFITRNLDKLAPGHKVTSVPVGLAARSFHDLTSADLTSEMPPVGNQGQQGSCASWAIAYYHRSQLEYHERHWDLTDPHHQFSAAFAYNQVNGGGDNGSSFDDNMPLICEQGCANLVDCPYNDGDCTSWPSESAYSHAIPFRARTWAWFGTADTTGIDMIKQLLANGSTACLGIAVYGNFDNIASYNYTYCASDRTGNNRGGHLVTFVGYNDTLTTHDGKGAFRMVNSWGTGWGQSGYFWMSYQAVMDGYLSSQTAGYMTDTAGYSPKLLARVQLSHPARERVGIEFSIGDRANPLWLYDFRTWCHPSTDQPFPANSMVFDLTYMVDDSGKVHDGASYIKNGQTDSIYFVTSAGDGKAGAVLSSSVQYLDWDTLFFSRSTPESIPANGDVVAVGHRIWEINKDKDVAANWIFTPNGVVKADSSYVPRAEVRNYGNSAASFPVRLTISTGYADTVQVTGLQPGHADTVQFKSWIAPQRCFATVRCSTALVGDQYEGDDVSTALVWAIFHDVGLTDIVSPSDTVDSGTVVRPQVRVWNYGSQTELVTATMRIPDEGYSRMTQVSVPSRQGMSVNFAAWAPKLVGSHVVRCSLSLAGDTIPSSDDTMSRQVVVTRAAGVAEAVTVPLEFRFDVPRPSIFSRSVAVAFALPHQADVSLSVYDATGAMVRKLRHGITAAGEYRLSWDGRNDEGRTVPAGTYFCRLDAGDHRATAVLLKL